MGESSKGCGIGSWTFESNLKDIDMRIESQVWRLSVGTCFCEEGKEGFDFEWLILRSIVENLGMGSKRRVETWNLKWKIVLPILELKVQWHLVLKLIMLESKFVDESSSRNWI